MKSEHEIEDLMRSPEMKALIKICARRIKKVIQLHEVNHVDDMCAPLRSTICALIMRELGCATKEGAIVMVEVLFLIDVFGKPEDEEKELEERVGIVLRQREDNWMIRMLLHCLWKFHRFGSIVAENHTYVFYYCHTCNPEITQDFEKENAKSC